MKIKLTNEQYIFLTEHLSKERPDLAKYFNKKANLIFEISGDIAIEIRDWAGEKMQREGFDINYNLNDAGVFLEQIEDILYS